MPPPANPRWTILHTEHSDGWGGQEMRIVSEARGVAARGHRVLLACRPGAAVLEPARAAGLETHTLPMPRNLDPAAIWRLRSLIRREGVDLVNTHSSIDAWIGGFAARLAGAALVRTRHVSKRVRAHPFNFIHRWPGATMTTGEALRRQFIEDTGVAPGSVRSVPTGVDVDHFALGHPYPDPRQALSLPPSARLVVNVAVLRRAKRHVVLVDAAHRLRHLDDLYFVIAGEGSQRGPIEQHIAELGLTDRVRLVGHLDDVRPLLAAADIVASASAGMEGVPQALMQALAMECPVAATDDGAVAELIVDGATGLLVPPEQPAALAQAIERLLGDREFASACGRRGRQHVVERYSLPAMIDAVIHTYRTVLP